jgi:hypothetical protein
MGLEVRVSYLGFELGCLLLYGLEIDIVCGVGLFPRVECPQVGDSPHIVISLGKDLLAQFSLSLLLMAFQSAYISGLGWNRRG